MQCKICNAEIIDHGYLVQKYGNAPDRCEKCRRESRNYRAKVNIVRKLLDQKVAMLGDALIEKAVREKAKEGKFGAVYSIGGRDFGPWGGAEFDNKYLLHVLGRTGELEKGVSYDFRLMEKTDITSGRSWTYIVLEPTRGKEETSLVIDLAFTRIWKWTFKGYGRQFDDVYPIEESHETILTGWSRARSGRFGNEWELFVKEVEACGVEDRGVESSSA